MHAWKELHGIREGDRGAHVRGHSLCGWLEKPELSSLFWLAHPQPYLGSIIGIGAIIFFLVEVGTGMVLSLEAKDSIAAEA